MANETRRNKVRNNNGTCYETCYGSCYENGHFSFKNVLRKLLRNVLRRSPSGGQAALRTGDSHARKEGKERFPPRTPYKEKGVNNEPPFSGDVVTGKLLTEKNVFRAFSAKGRTPLRTPLWGGL